jgi:hydroxymethylglutaryl-CoA reductase (NADPH)
VDNDDKERLTRRVVNGKLTLHQIDSEAPDANDAVEIRRRAVEKLTGTDLSNVGSAGMDYPLIKGRNAENVIGVVTVPMGVIGPLRVNGGHFRGETYVPLATTEGALIASLSRGIKALNMSGGATVRVIKDGITRGPVFKFNSIVDIERFLEWLPSNYEKIKAAAEGTMRHGGLKGITPYVTGNNVFLRFRYGTGDAMGMNMVTIATEAACEFIEKNFRGATLVAVTGNMCSDKKQSLVNSLEGRGKTVLAEAVITQKVLKEVFGATAFAVNDVNFRKNWAGSARAGSATQFNAHFANTVAAIFLATGQDAAQVVESSSGYTWTELRRNDLYISVTLTSLEVGTIGGGTGLPTQKEALSLMKISGSGNPVGSNSMKFAEIIAAAVMAGELNLLSALATRELGKAHQKLGRSKASLQPPDRGQRP